jgi:outer membrane receptor protein involved in Fe transport
MSNETRLFTLPDGTKGDLADGRGAHGTVLGFEFSQKVDGWAINNKMNYFNSDQPTIAMFSGPNAMTLQEQVNSFVSSANANAALVSAAGRTATGLGSAVYVDGGGAVPLNTQTIGEGLWTVDKKLKNFSDELRFTKEVVKNHKLTLGVYFSQYSTADVWDLGNHILMDLNGRPIQVTLDNGVKASNNRGFYDACGFCIAENGDTSNRAAYVADEWKVNDALTLDAGARYENQNMSLSFQSPSSTFIGNDPLAAYNYNVAQPTGPVLSYNPSWNLASFTVGGTYKLQKDMSVYVRANSGGQFPFFDQVRGSIQSDPPPVTKIKQLEVGFKAVGQLYSAFIGLFANKFDNQFLSVSNNNGVPSNSVGGSKTYGVEYELAVRPLPGFQVSFNGNAQHARYQDYNDAVNPGINGKMVQRQPASQWRLSPSYTIPIGDNELKVYGTYTHVNARYSDPANNEYLPSYHTVDAGVLYSVGDKLEFRLSGTNLTNEFGLTEGSAGRAVAGSVGVPYATIARPLFGRSVQLSALYRF